MRVNASPLSSILVLFIVKDAKLVLEGKGRKILTSNFAGNFNSPAGEIQHIGTLAVLAHIVHTDTIDSRLNGGRRRVACHSAGLWVL